MHKDKEIEEALHQAKTGTGKKVGYLVAAAAGVVTLIGAVIVGTRGHDIERSSAAMSDPERVAPVRADQDAGAP